MTAFRHLLAQRHVAVLLCVAALVLKLLVPTGYMIAADHGRIAISVCPGMVAAHADMPGHGKTADHPAPEQPCAFAGLSAAALGSVDAVLLAAAIAFVMVAAFGEIAAPRTVAPPHLRPPPRGPPATP